MSVNEPKNIAARGFRLAFSYVRLDAYRSSSLPADWLAKLDTALGAFKGSGVKIIVRFSYNFPASETEYRNAQDAPLARVQEHALQLAPLLAKHADSIAFLQAGFIGAWGEWHTSSNNLTTNANKDAVRDVLLAMLPEDKFLQIRYPGDLQRWRPTAPDESMAFTAQTRIGMHNDCFLASQTDVGTYEGGLNDPQRNYVKAASKVTPFGGETCNPADDAGAVMRDSCADILREGRDYSLAYLNRDYYTGFTNKWQAQGCLAEVSRSIGYRLQLDSLALPAQAQRGAAFSIQLKLTNTGWSRVFNPRPVLLVLRNVASGALVELPVTAADPRRWVAGQSSTVSTTITVPLSVAAGDYTVALWMPDGASALRSDAQYALRPANAADAARGQGWDAAAGRFNTGVALKIN
jgi:Domain of unknown function (DUF4832)/Domain of unknown function (DUF4874)